MKSEPSNDKDLIQRRTSEVTLNNSDIDTADSNVTRVDSDSDTDSVTTVISCGPEDVQRLQGEPPGGVEVLIQSSVHGHSKVAP